SSSTGASEGVDESSALVATGGFDITRLTTGSDRTALPVSEFFRHAHEVCGTLELPGIGEVRDAALFVAELLVEGEELVTQVDDGDVHVQSAARPRVRLGGIDEAAAETAALGARRDRE